MVLLAMATYPYKLNTLSVLAVLYRVVVTVGLELGKSANIGFVLLFRQLHVDLSLASKRHNNNNNKRPLTPKSMPPAGDEHAKLKT